MNLSLGMKAQIRTLVFLAGEPIPLFWPMRSFIHHNPLHGLEKLGFEQAVAEGSRLFHGRGFLPRAMYQHYCAQGRVDTDELEAGIERFLGAQPELPGLDLPRCLRQVLHYQPQPVTQHRYLGKLPAAADILAVLQQQELPAAEADPDDAIRDFLCSQLLCRHQLYPALDALFDTGIAADLDDLVIKSCLDFFDEGQSVWQMPDRERGFFQAWRAVARRDLRLGLHGEVLQQMLESECEPEEVIVHVMQHLKVPQQHWQACFQQELTHLHGWAGFIRWRSGARHYYYGRQYPGDLVDYLAIRLLLALVLIRERCGAALPDDVPALENFMREQPMQAYLRYRLYSKQVLPAWAHKVEAALLSGDSRRIAQLGREYLQAERAHAARGQATVLRDIASGAGCDEALLSMPAAQLDSLLDILRQFEQHEGMVWLRAMEAQAMHTLLNGIRPVVPQQKAKRPFVQALFCIDTRSERIRRHLERVGDYQTFGIAGFFGVPVSFMELGKGTEAHLCPVLLTPKNLVMEMSVAEVQDTVALSVMEKVVHELKETVLAPFVTVEAIGLIFGFDMIGKTLAPGSYNRWRVHMQQHKPHTHLLVDKLSREQADSIVRAVQRALIARAVEQEFELAPEHINDDMVRELREAALGHVAEAVLFQQELALNVQQAQAFIERLRTAYRINTSESRMQMERLGRIGFSLDEQVGFVSQALHAIGLTENFSRFILAVGHGSQSQNNPYESALDCGACGGNIGVHNARIFCHMANKPAVRARLQQQGLQIPDDAWFIPAMHNTTTDEIVLHDLHLLPSTHTIYLDRLRSGLTAACRLCAQERIPELQAAAQQAEPDARRASLQALRNALDWSQVRPEWGLSRNCYFIIGRRELSSHLSLQGRAFLHSYDYRVDHKLLLLENILTGPLVVAQWINMEHYFSAVDNESYGSGSKVYHNVAGRFAVMTGNLGDLRTGLPAQTVLIDGRPYHEPLRLITLIEAPFEHVISAINRVASARRLLANAWIRLIIVDPETGKQHVYDNGQWQPYPLASTCDPQLNQESLAS